jgi:spore coat polysaccharide biosynthesis predicted glycosyltransferase SpsG
MCLKLKNKEEVYFRTDFNSKIGLGHYSRCISIAEIVQNKYHVNFVLNRNITSIELLKTYKYPFYLVNDDKEFLTIIKYGSVVVIDSYEFNEDLQSELNKLRVKLIVIDDLNNMIYDCNAIINHGVYFKKNDYKCNRINTRLYLGLDYLMVKKEFRERSIKQPRNKIKYKFENVIICLGGTDQTLLINEIIETLAEEGVKKFSILIGSDYENKIIKNISNKTRIETYTNLSPTSVIEIFETADFAVLPASTILLEAFTVGIPIISGWFVENQKYSLDKFEEMGLIINLNNFNTNDFKSKLTKAYLSISQNRDIIINQKKYINLNIKNYLKIFNDLAIDN